MLLKRVNNLCAQDKKGKENVPYRLNLLRLKQSNLKATVRKRKCMNIGNFDFDPLRVKLGTYGSFFDETNPKNN